MFDVGFLELVLIAIIGLLVLGPERLPVAARTLGRWFGKARRMTSQFTQEINRQIELEDLKSELKKQGESLDINEDVEMIQNTVKDALKEAEEFEPLPRDEYDKLFQAPKEPDSSKDLQSNTQNDKPKQS
ncbi:MULTISPECIES: Sec-independent protein translocase protein TatB [unclassified Oleiphilus]|jgi:sec-independent protein translocase protein TatB|uniref:Sec-independent protein translocase protein TatB n=1 Tax=unclassified Oleiphilus TaxID=2631174 RepID=UPI0007C2CA8E|nr:MULTISPECIES: Sec-independent protein translocase protein TatB [unclassified Oleiphilus]KZY45028.1 hypothetical protein A3732_11255 [Oleiphilus sp. HI0050]KZY76457.1 hypothetical protein A3740_12800 [Oleiphilus sp. HI0068]KZY80027.1 hypothetical protein A3741_19440 [Oleiphilus sp. HI0069]KZY87695.1 hypothetical protein A3743_13755 [Oleiphilus sp. HI0072]KZZ07745.1 hypothetical protein A3749_15095 [Oleiphilus sp. HI0078]KZZ30256.1 hypothetical protein A3752_17355 [Oleiphilus sp. HI0081]KZZ